jgi:hypothetical protein
MVARAPQAVAFDEAIALAEVADDVATVARVTAAMARPIIGLDRLGEHNERMRRTLDGLGGRLDDPTRARLILAFATSSIQLGRSEEALPLLDEALAIMERDWPTTCSKGSVRRHGLKHRSPSGGRDPCRGALEPA